MHETVQRCKGIKNITVHLTLINTVHILDLSHFDVIASVFSFSIRAQLDARVAWGYSGSTRPQWADKTTAGQLEA